MVGFCSDGGGGGVGGGIFGTGQVIRCQADGMACTPYSVPYANRDCAYVGFGKHKSVRLTD